MVAVGCLYIRSKEAKAKEILKDLVELCKGVQHPTRGLFLRSYLCQRSKGLLPDTGSAYEGEGGDIYDAVDFLLSNFIEMNKLWVRMQHQVSASVPLTPMDGWTSYEMKHDIELGIMAGLPKMLLLA